MEVLEAGRAEQLIQTFNAAGKGDKAASEIMANWSDGDRELFDALMRATAEIKRAAGDPDDGPGDGAEGGAA